MVSNFTLKNKSEKTKELVATMKAEKEELESSLSKEKIHSLQLKQELADAENRNTELYKVIALPKTNYILEVRGELLAKYVCWDSSNDASFL